MNRLVVSKWGCAAALFIAIATIPMVLGLDGSIVSKMLSFDRNRDGVIGKNEVSDPRLLKLFERYDANKDSSLSREELVAGAEQDSPGSTASDPAALQSSAATLPPTTSEPGGRTTIARPTGIGGGGAPMASAPVGAKEQSVPFPDGLTRIGQIIPDDIRDNMDLSDKQKKQIEELEKDVANRLSKMLNAKQTQLLKERLERNAPTGKPAQLNSGTPPQQPSEVDR
jgi:hypothetical protein